METSFLGLLYGVGAASIWGGMYVVSKVVLDIIPPFTLLTMRLILGILVLWVFVAKNGGLQLSKRIKLQALVVGLLGYGISLGFQFVGTKLSTASNGALVTSTTPAFVFLFAALILNEKITFRKTVALFVSSVGVLIVLNPYTANFASNLFWGNLCLVAAALTWALYSVLVRKVAQMADVLPLTLLFFCGGILFGIPASLIELTWIPIGLITPGVIAGILYLGVISTALAMFWWNRAFALTDAGSAGLTFFVQPVVGVGLGVIFLGEQITILFLTGGILIGIGLWLSTK